MVSNESVSGNQQQEHSPAGESFYVQLRKFKGEEECKLIMDMSSAQAGLTGLMILLEKYSEVTELSIIKVLSLLTVALVGETRKQKEDSRD